MTQPARYLDALGGADGTQAPRQPYAVAPVFTDPTVVTGGAGRRAPSGPRVTNRPAVDPRPAGRPMSRPQSFATPTWAPPPPVIDPAVVAMLEQQAALAAQQPSPVFVQSATVVPDRPAARPAPRPQPRPMAPPPPRAQLPPGRRVLPPNAQPLQNPTTQQFGTAPTETRPAAPYGQQPNLTQIMQQVTAAARTAGRQQRAASARKAKGSAKGCLAGIFWLIIIGVVIGSGGFEGLKNLIESFFE